MPSHLRPRPGTASAADRLSIGRLVGEQCNFDQSSIVARMSSRAMQNGRSWVKKRNLGQKNETRARKTGFSALFLSTPIERGGEIRKNFLGWQTILLRHTGDFQKTVLLGLPHCSCTEMQSAFAGASVHVIQPGSAAPTLPCSSSGPASASSPAGASKPATARASR